LPGGPVQTAQLLERAGQSEMRIALSTTAFGNVEVHTVVHANEVGVSIGSEKGDLRSLLTNDLPAISSTLQQQNVRLHHVDFQNSSTLSNSPGGNSQQPRSFTRPTVHLADLDNAIRPGDGFDPIEGAVRGLNTGLNILA
jgi:flagellar hook-length control protein FliK